MLANPRTGDFTAPQEIAISQHNTDAALAKRAIEHGLTPVAARVLANRQLNTNIDLGRFLDTPLSALDPPDALADIEVGAHRLAAAIIAREPIAIQTDYDTDGLGAHATFLHAVVGMFGHPRELVQSIVGNRLTEGYGLTQPVAERILTLPTRPTVCLLYTSPSPRDPE